MRHTAEADAELLEFGDGVQDQSGLAPEPVDLVNQELIELAEPGVSENMAAVGEACRRKDPRNRCSPTGGLRVRFPLRLASLSHGRVFLTPTTISALRSTRRLVLC